MDKKIEYVIDSSKEGIKKAREKRLQAISILWYKEGWTYEWIMNAFEIPRNRICDIVQEATLKYPKGEN